MKSLSNILLLTLLSVYPIIAQVDPSFYKIDLQLVPEKQSLEANVDLTYYANKDQSDSLTFLLYRDFSIKTLTCNNLVKYTFDTEHSSPYQFAPKAGILTIYLNKPLYKGEVLQVKLQYAGEIRRGFFEALFGRNVNNRITEEWTEIGKYTPWFPFKPEIKNFTYQVNVKISSKYKVFGNGKTKEIGNHWEILQDRSSDDIVIMASKDINTKNIQKNGLSLDINYSTVSDSTANDILNNALWILEKYNEWFSDIKVNHASLVITPRNKGASYSRRGFVVFTSFDDDDYYQSEVRYFKLIAHEFSHFWWNKAPTTTWEDWLNESFAEYSSLMAIREKFGIKEFEKIIQKKQKQIKGLPAIRGIDRDSKNAHTVLYDKGCVLLNKLESEIGKENFQKLLKQLVINKVNSTEQFLKVLMNLTSVEVSKHFEEKLDR